MKTLLRLSVWLMLLSVAAISQTNVVQQTGANSAPTSSNFTSAKGFVLEDGTPIKMRINRTISSGDAHIGDTIDFEVLDISVNGTLVIPCVSLSNSHRSSSQAQDGLRRKSSTSILTTSNWLVVKRPHCARGQGQSGGVTPELWLAELLQRAWSFPQRHFSCSCMARTSVFRREQEVTAYVKGHEVGHHEVSASV